jgi:hypothetical protein
MPSLTIVTRLHEQQARHNRNSCSWALMKLELGGIYLIDTPENVTGHTHNYSDWSPEEERE